MVIVLTKTLDTYIIAHVQRGAYTKCDLFQIYPYIWSKQNLIGTRHIHIL